MYAFIMYIFADQTVFVRCLIKGDQRRRENMPSHHAGTWINIVHNNDESFQKIVKTS